MITSLSDPERPPDHLDASDYDRLFARLALRLAHLQLAIAAMLLDQIESAELSDPQTIPPERPPSSSSADEGTSRRPINTRRPPGAGADRPLNRLSVKNRLVGKARNDG